MSGMSRIQIRPGLGCILGLVAGSMLFATLCMTFELIDPLPNVARISAAGHAAVVAGLAALTFVFSLFLVFPPFFLAYWVAERLRIRSVIYYCLTGCLTATVIAHFIARVRHGQLAAAIAGAIAGGVYWFYALDESDRKMRI